MDADRVLEIMYKVPNIMLFEFVTHNYDDVKEEFCYKCFPITEEEFNEVKGYLRTHLSEDAVFYMDHPEELDNRPGYEEVDEDDSEDEHYTNVCGTTFDNLVDMADKIDMSRKEEASRYLDGLLRKKQLKDNQILIDASLLIRDKPYRKALRALIKKHKVKVATVFLGRDEGDIAMIYNKELNCLAINENTSWQNTLTALNRIAEMDSIPRDKDYQFVIGWKTK